MGGPAWSCACEARQIGSSPGMERNVTPSVREPHRMEVRMRRKLLGLATMLAAVLGLLAVHAEQALAAAGETLQHCEPVVRR